MISIIIGNSLSLAAMVTDSISSSRKTSREVLLVQSLSQIFYMASAVVLKGYSAAVQNVVSILRNIYVVRKKKDNSGKIFEWVLIIIAVSLGLYFNNRGLVGLLPVIANLEYSIAVSYFKENEYVLKIAFFINTLLFVVFNIVIWNFVGVISNLIVIISTAVFIIKERKAMSTDESLRS